MSNGTRLVVAVVVSAYLGWWAYGEFAEPETCAGEPNPDSWPAECVVDYTRWLFLIDPNVRFRDDYSLSIQDDRLFEACIAAVGSTHDTPVGWLIDIEGGRYARDVSIPDRVLDACREYGMRGPSEVDWITRE